MNNGFFLGIDTSNYTTSAAAGTVAGEIFCAKRPLTVASGERGLRQSDALFCHIKALGEVVRECMASLTASFPKAKLLGVGVSQTPRRVEGSYMPCFLAGVSAAESIAAAAGVPFFTFSHQEGHIEAARLGAREAGHPLREREFLAFHLSGGTTELLSVREDGARYEVEPLAEVLDLTCGQFIDRCGVKLGLAFPCGAALEELAAKGVSHRRIRICRKENAINLSGFENQFDRALSEGKSREELAAFVFAVVEEAIRTLLGIAREKTSPTLPVLFSGGVASSHLIKERLADPLHHFAPPRYCADNAIGIAALTGKELSWTAPLSR